MGEAKRRGDMDPEVQIQFAVGRRADNKPILVMVIPKAAYAAMLAGASRHLDLARDPRRITDISIVVEAAEDAKGALKKIEGYADKVNKPLADLTGIDWSTLPLRPAIEL